MSVLVQRRDESEVYLRLFLTTIVLLFLFIGYSFVLLNYSDPAFKFGPLYLLMLIQFTPFAVAFCRQQFDYISFVLFNHLVTYSVAKLNAVTNVTGLGGLYPETVMAINELMFCTVLMTAAYYVSRQFLFYRFVEKEKYQMLSLNVKQLIFVAGYVISVPIFIRELPSMALAFHFAAMAADMVLLLCSNSPGRERLAFWLRIGAFVSAIWYFLATGFLSMIGNLAGYLFITGCLRKSVRALAVPVFLAILASAVQTVKASYRTALYENWDASITQKASVLGTLIWAQYFNDEIQLDEEEDRPEDKEKDGLLHGFNRVGDDSLERVLTMTPSQVPFWEGETYASIPYMFIPRVLWPDKPTRHFWNKFGRTYGYLGEEDESTSVAVNYFAEGFMNFGYTGMYAVAVFMGFFIALVERLSYYFLKGYFYFTFVCFLMPLMAYAIDLTSVVNAVIIQLGVLTLFRTQFVKMARRDEYS